MKMLVYLMAPPPLLRVALVELLITILLLNKGVITLILRTYYVKILVNKENPVESVL